MEDDLNIQILVGKSLDCLIANDEFGKAIDFISENPNSINWSFYIDRLMNPIHLVSNKISNRKKQKLLDIFAGYIDNIPKSQVNDLKLVASFIKAKLTYIFKVRIDFSFISKFEIMCSEKIGNTGHVIHPHSFLTNSSDISIYDADFVYEYVVNEKSFSEIISYFFKKADLNKLADKGYYSLVPFMVGYSLFSNFFFNRCELHNMYATNVKDAFLIYKLLNDFLNNKDDAFSKGHKRNLNFARSISSNNRYNILAKCYIQYLFGENKDTTDVHFQQLFYSMVIDLIKKFRLIDKTTGNNFDVFDEVILENAILGRDTTLNDLYNSIGQKYEKDAIDYFVNMNILKCVE